MTKCLKLNSGASRRAVLDWAMTQGAKDGGLFKAAYEGSRARTWFYLRIGGNPNAEQENRWTSVDAAMFWRGHDAIRKRICKPEKQALVLLKMLQAHGAELAPHNERGSERLWCALNFKQNAIYQLLIQAGADPNLQYTVGELPLHSAIQQKDLALIRRLLKAGANANTRARTGNLTPLQEALRMQESDCTGEMNSIILELLPYCRSTGPHDVERVQRWAYHQGPLEAATAYEWATQQNRVTVSKPNEDLASKTRTQLAALR
jgi:ankyrin repeat protein